MTALNVGNGVACVTKKDMGAKEKVSEDKYCMVFTLGKETS